MKVGIIVHSQTGNTLSVAEQVRERLVSAGHSVSIERVAAIGGDDPSARNVKLEALPDISGYDGLIFAAPVRGMSISPVIAACLTEVPPLAGKKVACFVTEQFPFPWLGGNNAIAKMKAMCESKQGTVARTGIVNWSGGRREKQISELVEELGRLF